MILSLQSIVKKAFSSVCGSLQVLGGINYELGNLA